MYELVTSRNAVTGEFITETVGIKAKASTQLILVAPVGVVDGTNPDAHVEMIGVGPLPRNILRTLSPDTELAGMIFDRAGRPLWLGRNQRLGNAAQRLAIAVRDGDASNAAPRCTDASYTASTNGIATAGERTSTT